ncbi:MAG: glycine/betaine/sarcosine/D-proline family reductase selenoprotein B [Chloroflexota bacterium]|nr:glycine/betaine/sarcosine/D-proline family reductase selenoprotein B [Chloroflexota bacterium]
MNKQSRLTSIGRLRERLLPLSTDTAWGRRAAYWLGRTLGGLEYRLKRIRVSGDIPWTPLKRPLAEAMVALVSTGGVHLCSQPPFNLHSDASFRVIPRGASREELCITHEHYDQRDAGADPNLVFPLERLLELEAAGIIGRVADAHYGFGFVEYPQELQAPGQQVGALLAQAHVDLAILVPA